MKQWAAAAVVLAAMAGAGGCFSTAAVTDSPEDFNEATPVVSSVARWQNNADGAYIIHIDDGCKSVVDLAVPLLVKYQIPVTCYICPDWDSFRERLDDWKKAAQTPYITFGNHTARHCGGQDYAAVEKEIADGDQMVRELTGKAPGELVSFATPGAVAWKVMPSEHDQLLKKYNNVQRFSFGDNVAGRRINTAADLINEMDRAAKDHEAVAILFHGIGGDWFKFDINEFEAALIELAKRRDANVLWLAPSLNIQMYIEERDNAQVKAVFNGKTVRVSLEVRNKPLKYDEKLTLIVEVPQTWHQVEVTTPGENFTVTAENGKALINVAPETGLIYLRQAELATVR